MIILFQSIKDPKKLPKNSIEHRNFQNFRRFSRRFYLEWSFKLLTTMTVRKWFPLSKWKAACHNLTPLLFYSFSKQINAINILHLKSFYQFEGNYHYKLSLLKNKGQEFKLCSISPFHISLKVRSKVFSFHKESKDPTQQLMPTIAQLDMSRQNQRKQSNLSIHYALKVVV